MARQVMQVQDPSAQQNMMGQTALSVGGTALGSFFGGPAGGAAGGALGGAIGGAAFKDRTTQPIESPQSQAMQPQMTKPEESSIVDRRMQALQNDPMTTMKEGRDALKGYDSKTREALEPVLDEAIKRAAEERARSQQYGSASYTA